DEHAIYQQVEIQRTRRIAYRTPASMPVFDHMQCIEQFMRRQSGLQFGHSIDEVRLVGVADGIAAVERRGSEQPRVIDAAEFRHGLAYLLHRIFEIRAEAHESLHRNARDHSDVAGTTPGSALPPPGLRLRRRRRGLRSGRSICLRVSSSAFWKFSHHSAISASTSP